MANITDVKWRTCLEYPDIDHVIRDLRRIFDEYDYYQDVPMTIPDEDKALLHRLDLMDGVDIEEGFTFHGALTIRMWRVIHTELKMARKELELARRKLEGAA